MKQHERKVVLKYRNIGFWGGSVFGLITGLFVGAESTLDKSELIINMGLTAMFFVVIFGITGFIVPHIFSGIGR